MYIEDIQCSIIEYEIYKWNMTFFIADHKWNIWYPFSHMILIPYPTSNLIKIRFFDLLNVESDL